MHKGSSAKSWRNYKTRYNLEENEGKLITWSIVHGALKGYEDFAPYIIGIVEFKNKKRMTTQIVDIDSNKLKNGLKVKAVFRKIYQDGDKGIIDYGLKFTLTS